MEGSDSPSDFPSATGDLNLVLYKSESCGFCRRVVHSIAELGLTEVVDFADVDRDPQALQTLQSRTGRRTVPCLFIDENPHFESRDIIRWLSAYASGDE
jgi:glutaredoxin